MKPDDFESFYAEHLVPHMDRLKKECKASDKWIPLGIISFVLAILLLLLGFEWLNYYLNIILIVCMAIVFIVCVVKRSTGNEAFVYDYKQSVVNEIINHLNPGMTYKPDNFIPEKEFLASSLYRYKYNAFDGEDLLDGTYNNIRFHCSEVYLGVESRDRYNDSFRCMFFTAGISKSFDGGTYIWDRDFEQLPASIYDEEYRMNPMPRVVRVSTPNAVFNKYFSACSTQPSQSGMILTADRVQRIAALKANLNAPIALSFVTGRCFVMFGIDKNYMEPDDYYPDDTELAAKYYDTVKSIFYMIEQLDLEGLV